MPWSSADRRNYAIARQMHRSIEELKPLRQEISDRIDQVGWRAARPVIRGSLGRPVQRRGLWTLGKRDTSAVLAALSGMSRQASLFEHEGAP
jgi:hypothetical protein